MEVACYRKADIEKMLQLTSPEKGTVDLANLRWPVCSADSGDVCLLMNQCHVRIESLLPLQSNQWSFS